MNLMELPSSEAGYGDGSAVDDVLTLAQRFF
jgi:hypothetical protein